MREKDIFTAADINWVVAPNCAHMADQSRMFNTSKKEDSK